MIPLPIAPSKQVAPSSPQIPQLLKIWEKPRSRTADPLRLLITTPAPFGIGQAGSAAPAPKGWGDGTMGRDAVR